MVRLSDVFMPEVYGSYTSLNNTENNALIASGIIAVNDTLNTIARQGGKEGTVPYWMDINPDLEPNYSNDDPADLAVPNKVGTGTMKYRKAFMNQSFGSMDLVTELSGQAPLEHIKRRFDNYWVAVQQRRLVATCVGILNQNVASGGGDMVVDISAAVTTTDPDAQKFSGDAFIDAAFTMGDRAESIKAIAVHSAIAAKMTKNNEIESIRDSEGKVIYRTYKERVVIVDDGLPVSGAGADRVYTSILFGVGAFGFGGEEGHAFALGEGTPMVGVWTERTEQAGNGGGMEVIGERKTWVLHPFGFSWIEDPTGTADDLVEFSPTYADLRKAAHWTRVAPRKAVPIAFIKSKA